MDEYKVVGDPFEPYQPGEPYEFTFVDTFLGVTVRGYRCFRGGCGTHGGMVAWVADRNTHNQYHNRKGE